MHVPLVCFIIQLPTIVKDALCIHIKTKRLNLRVHRAQQDQERCLPIQRHAQVIEIFTVLIDNTTVLAICSMLHIGLASASLGGG